MNIKYPLISLVSYLFACGILQATEQASAEVAPQTEISKAEEKPDSPQELGLNSDFKLTVTKEQGEVIEEIITTMGNTSVIGLGFKQAHLRALGKKLDNVGPLQFLGYIFSREDLKEQMKNIKKSSFKWNGFMDGITPGLNREASTQLLYKELPGFAHTVKVEVDPLKQKAEEKDWNGFVAYLVAQ